MQSSDSTVQQDLESLARMRRIDVGVLSSQIYMQTLTTCDKRMRQLMAAQLRIAQLETELATAKLELETARQSPNDSTCISPRGPPQLSPRIHELTPAGSISNYDQNFP